MSLCEWSLVLTGGGVEGGAGQEYLHDCAPPPSPPASPVSIAWP